MDHKNIFSKLRTIRKSKVRTLHHLDNYSKYISSGTIPNGLKINLTPHCPGHKSNNFLKRWNKIISDTSFRLLHLLNSYCTHQLSEIQVKEHTKIQELSEVCSNEQLQLYTDKLDTFSNVLQSDLKAKQSRKFRQNNTPDAQPVPEETRAKPAKKRNRRFRRRLDSQSKKPATNTVVNLSSVDLTDSDISLLSKGLNFCPRPKTYNAFEVEKDMEAFARRLRLKELFANKHNEESVEPTEEQLKFRPKSSFVPPKQSSTLEAFITAVERDIRAHTPTNTRRDNLSPSERKSLTKLRGDDRIVIKPADKGSSVVVQDTEDYIAEAERQLSDNRFYQKLDHDPTKEHEEAVCKTLYAMHDAGYIDEKTLQYLLPDNSKPGRFYLLPKIHKEGNPGRPIISANQHPTEKISEFIDYHLRPFVNKLPSYIQDTTDYINKTPKHNLPGGTLLLTLDVVSLYTNIPHEEGIEACREVWDTRQSPTIPTRHLVELLTHVLKLNNFEFNGEHYLQVNGTAMGTKMAPSYANIFMGRLESQLIQRAPYRPLSWYRFIDDIEAKWTDTREHLDEFLEFANSFHPSIKFTADISQTSNTFLDTKSTLNDDGTINTDLYCKPVDAHQYLLPSSCHPRHIIKNLPKGLAIRTKRICSNPVTCEKRLDELSSQLKRRNYKNEQIERAFSETRAMDRNALLRYKDKSKNTRVPFVVTFHPDGPNFRNIIRKHWGIIESVDEVKNVFGDQPMVAFRRPKNIKDHLVRAKINKPHTKQSGTTKCGHGGCRLCRDHMPETSTFKSTVTGVIYNIHQNLNCNSRNVIYLITCRTCGIQYVGETKTRFRERINNHKSAINNRYDNSVARHYNSPGHSLGSFEVLPIDQNLHWSDHERGNREKFWMRQLCTLASQGLNDRT